MLEILQEKVQFLERRLEQNHKQRTAATIDINAESAYCCKCGRQMTVRKTVIRKIITLKHNQFHARERVLHCPSKCKHENGAFVISREAQLCALVPNGSNYGYDLEVFVGIERFIKHRQREEIKKILKESYEISISDGEISALAARFLSHIEELHKSHSDDLRAALLQDGGYPLHIDATNEDGKGTLLVILAGWRHWVLGAWKIPSENTEAITPRILEISNEYGEPCAIMRDLGSPISRAVDDAICKMVSSPRVFACHFHFLRDIGKDLLDNDHDDLRKLIRRLSIREKIRLAVRETRKKTDSKTIAYIRSWFDSWLIEDKAPYLPDGPWGISLVVSIGLWILDYNHDGQHHGFPFDCLYHNLYLRCKTADKAIGFFLNEHRFDRDVNKALTRLRKTITPLLESKDVRKTVRDLEMRMALFSKLRNIFRLESTIHDSISPNNIISTSTNSGFHGNSFDKLEIYKQKQLRELTAKLMSKNENMSSAPDLKRSIKIILDHLDKHGSYLWGHLMKLQTQSGIQYRLVDRTNNILECFFHKMKHGERRRSGRKLLTRDFELIPPASALAMNLMDQDYVKIVCGTLENLPCCFSKIDQDIRTESLKVNKINSLSDIFDNEELIFLCSDKSFVRRESLNNWILSAAKHRPINMVNKKPKITVLPPFEDMEEFLQKEYSLHII
jgi:hypothetical protein